MKNYVSIVLLFFSGLLFSCSEETVISGATYCKTFITGYLTPETISVENANSEIKLTFKGKIITSGKTFDELSKYYNDLTYNRYVVNGPRIAVNDSVCKMTIKTVDDFDASHLAGSDISDLVECQYVSYYDYIHNDYKIVNTKALQTQGLNGYSYIEGAEIKNMNLAEICYDNTKLIAPEFMLKFKKAPEKKGEYHFDLTVILNGEKLTKTIDFVFK